MVIPLIGDIQLTGGPQLNASGPVPMLRSGTVSMTADTLFGSGHYHTGRVVLDAGDDFRADPLAMFVPLRRGNHRPYRPVLRRTVSITSASSERRMNSVDLAGSSSSSWSTCVAVRLPVRMLRVSTPMVPWTE